jgi:hypothetical protein
MNWEALGAIGEIVAAVAVVVSLIYLAVQIRQNTRWLRASTHHSLTSLTVEMNRVIEENPDMARIMRVGTQDFQQLTPDERLRFNTNLTSRFRHHENLYYQYRSGMLDEEEFSGFRRRFAWHLRFPGTLGYWRNARDFHSDEFADYVDSLVDEEAGKEDAAQEPVHP